jgi:SAM-dependent methyltransferase
MDRKYFDVYYVMERNHWWFTARMEILKDQVAGLIKDDRKLKILNIGVATGLTTKMLENFGDVTSLEYDKDCCEFLKKVVEIEVVNGSMTDLPFEDNTFDLVCAFDVIEHIDEDSKAVAEARRVLKEKGSFIFTVPAYQFLWSSHDDVNHHMRRYTKAGFTKLLLDQGLKINYSTYFNSILFLPIAAFRLIANVFKKFKGKEQLPKSDFENVKSEGFVNDVLYRIFLIEKPLLNRSIKLPFGVSCLIHGIK